MNELTYKGVRIIASEGVKPDGVIVIPNGVKYYYNIRAKKDGTPDMRYKLNRFLEMLGKLNRNKVQSVYFLSGDK